MKPKQTYFVKPGFSKKLNKLLIVRDPITLKPLAEVGDEKPVNGFWTRRIMCGDAVEVAREKQEKPAKAKPEPKKGDDK